MGPFCVKLCMMLYWSIHIGVDCRKNTSFKLFVVVIPKEGLAHQPFVWYDTDYRFVICSLLRLHCIVGVIPKGRLTGGPPPANLSLVWQGKRFKRRVFAAPDFTMMLMVSCWIVVTNRLDIFWITGLIRIKTWQLLSDYVSIKPFFLYVHPILRLWPIGTPRHNVGPSQCCPRL